MRKNCKNRPKKASASSTKSQSAKQHRGDDLFNQVIRLTGIPAKTIKRELKSILDRKNIDVNNLTIDQLRCVVASYLREIMGGLVDRYGQRKSES